MAAAGRATSIACRNTPGVDVVEKHAPNAYKAMDQGVEIQSLLSRYDKAIAGVHSSFYNPTVAAQAETHVAVA
ncbi:hypothetical protein MB818_02460 [Ruegeria sp. 1NDH52C]|uniref:Uncharacterized protein n=1 Tax=Ruegeria alba TaxID=2916756 RepID=A0ABS9NSR9_9RHOB|nr:hypothetical protein [Ruegeria alba]MCE8527752.1 hypothetical protein [Ruegeria pomeroyi]MCG6557046.1 hypothetical protein [Ruegeria alba]